MCSFGHYKYQTSPKYERINGKTNGEMRKKVTVGFEGKMMVEMDEANNNEQKKNLILTNEQSFST